MDVVKEADGLPRTPGMRAVAPWLQCHRGLLVLLLDLVTVAGSYMFAYYVRFFIQDVSIKYVPVAEIVPYLRNAFMLSGIWCFLCWREGVYECDLRGIAAPMIRLRSLLVSGMYATGFMIVVSYMYGGPDLSRQVYVMTVPTAVVGISLLRHLARWLDVRMRTRYGGTQKLIVAGTDSQAVEFIHRLQQMNAPFEVTGILGPSPACADDTPVCDIPYLGPLSDLPTIFARMPFSTLVLSMQGLEGGPFIRAPQEVVRVLNFCEQQEIQLYSLQSFYDISILQSDVGSLSGMPLTLLRDAHQHPAYSVVKRCMDVAVAVTVILVGMPLWLLIAFLITREDRGPVLFTQTRAGLNGKPFSMYKFRSMVVDAEKRLPELVDLDGLKEPVFKLRADPRITRVGRFLRRTGLDEIPQMLNVLTGEMSVVGPRPEEVAMVRRYDDWQRRRLKVKPGMTGFQQITNRGEPSLAERVRCDLIYMRHQSLLFDWYIMLRTVLVLLRGEGTY